MQTTRGQVNITIGPAWVTLCFYADKKVLMAVFSIEYNKKKDKLAVVKAVKDETVLKDDVYKSHTIHVPSGEPPNSKSRPAAKRKAGVVRPITKGKLLRKGGPSTDVRNSLANDFFPSNTSPFSETEAGVQTQASGPGSTRTKQACFDCQIYPCCRHFHIRTCATSTSKIRTGCAPSPSEADVQSQIRF
jgi:hypothetical protein